jgi:membrane protein required for colicin V production
MESLPINIADLVIVVVLLLSALLAFARGFVKELLSIVGWIGAAIASVRLFPYFKPYVGKLIDEPLLVDAVTGGGIFIVTLLLIWLASSVISRRVQDSEIGALDRSLGFVFGLLRGAIVVSLAFLIYSQFVVPKDRPEWLNEARAIPLVQYGAELILVVVPEDMRKSIESSEDWAQSPKEAWERVMRTKNAAETLKDALEGGNSGDTKNESGYTGSQRKQLDRKFGNVKD